MQCTSCGLHSDNLREYSRAVDLGDYRKTIDTIFLCAACRVFNAVNPKYVAKRIQRDPIAIVPPASSEWNPRDKQTVRERNLALSSGV
ncbi:MAG: hypothetical protein ABJB01_03285 [Rudaea sp.]